MDGRQTMTLSEQLATPDPAIRDFLKIPQDDDADAGPHEGGSPAARDADGGGMLNWKPLRDRLRLRRAANIWHTTHPAPKGAAAPATATNSGLNNRSSKYNYSPGEAAAAFSRTVSRAPSLGTTPTFSRASSTRFGPNSSRSSSRRPVVAAAYEPRIEDHAEDRGEDNDDDEDDSGEEKDDEEAPAAQMSLMALLEQTDNWDDDEDEEGGGEARKNGGADDEEDDGEGREEEMVHVCCVCMVQHKGAAFIPCGHTFCRLCSRELWVSRGNCPLCNGFIQEILDIF